VLIQHHLASCVVSRTLNPVYNSDEALIGYNGGHLKIMDLFLPVNSASVIKFKPVRINEKKISTKGYERKHFFVDD